MAGTFVSSILHTMTNKLVSTIQISSISASSSSSCNSSSVDEDLKKLKKTLLRIQAVLHDAEEREIRDESVKLWLTELKDVAYDAVDVLDEYDYELLRSKLEAEEDVTETTTGKRKREKEVSHSTTTLAMDGMSHRVKEIRERFDEIAKDRDALHLREGDGERRFENTITTRPPTSSHVVESNVYGREAIKSELIELLLPTDNYGGDNFSVIPLVGIGGIGKTTIAQLVYNDPTICQYFDLRGWVCVSVDFDVTRLTRAIIESITGSPCMLIELSTLQDTLQKILERKKLLLVLDDVWNEKQSQWESLRAPFICPGVIKMIITTRNKSVAKIMQTMPHIQIDCLPEDLCWLLFQERAFCSQGHNANTNLVEIGKKIIKKCGGLPLAVKTLAGLLQYETNEERWTDILESDIWELDEKNDEIMPALRLSYHHMPTCLRPCFVYCSLFPKDHTLSKNYLVKLWMAQGFVQLRGSKRMEDIGSEYFDELLNRSFFQYKLIGDDNEYLMHDLIHDLAQFISNKECFRIESEKAAIEIPIEARHLSMIHLRELKQIRSFNKLRTLRAFICVPLFLFYNAVIIPMKMVNDMFLFWGCLWTLDLCCCKLGHLPESIGNLKHLRYLRLGGVDAERLPESICHLYNLQTLDLYYCRCLRELPRGIRNLINLRHLLLPYNIMPPRVGKLTALQTLNAFCVKTGSRNCGMEELKELVNLRELEIAGLSCVVNVEDAKEANLKGKRCLQTLELNWSGFDNDVVVVANHEGVLQALQPHTNLERLSIYYFRGVRFPNWIGDPSFYNLVTLELCGCYHCEFLPPLGQLPSLTTLTIHSVGIRFVGREEWCEVLDGEFPKLYELALEYCPKLTSVAGLQNMTSLQVLKIWYCPKLRPEPDERLQSNPKHVDFRMCPGMEEWSRRRGFEI